MAQQEEARYVGVSIEEAIKLASEQLKTGTYSDGTRMPPRVRERYSQIVKELQEHHSPAARNYVFVYSRHILVIIDK